MVNPKLKKIKRLILFFIIMLVLSGITAFGVESQLNWFIQTFPSGAFFLNGWLLKVQTAIHQTNQAFPFLSYGYDWLAFAHIVIAIAFYGPYKDPQRNIWIIEWAMIACVTIIPLALIAGPVRDIPFYWCLSPLNDWTVFKNQFRTLNLGNYEYKT